MFVTPPLLGRALTSILSRLSSVVLSLHWYCKFCCSMSGICVKIIKPGLSPECGIPEKELTLALPKQAKQHLEIVAFSWIFSLLDWNFLQISALKCFVWLGASTAAGLLWKLEMALTSPKPAAGDLIQREESILHEGNCCHFLSANILTVGEWKVPSFHLIVWYWQCTLFFFSKFAFIVLIFHVGLLVFLKFEGTMLVYSSVPFSCVVDVLSRALVVY